MKDWPSQSASLTAPPEGEPKVKVKGRADGNIGPYRGFAKAVGVQKEKELSDQSRTAPLFLTADFLRGPRPGE